MNTSYRRAYSPPAPVVEIQLAAPGLSPSVAPVMALIDTGADTSVLPKSTLLTLGAPSLYEAQLRSPWGEPYVVMRYLVDIIMGAERLPGVEIAADENDTEFILGRNFLNRLPLLLDGPQQVKQLLLEPALQYLRAARPSTSSH